MIEWTTSARAELERYCARVRPDLETAGADAAEVEDDLRRHIDEEALAGRLRAVTEDDVRRILARVGTPRLPSEPNTTPLGKAVADTAEGSGPSPRPLRLGALVFGVVLPFVTLAIELATHMCGGAFFDPIPTGWHVLLVGSVPVANGLAWRAVRRGDAAGRTALGWINGFALGIALFYALIFLPLMPAALFALVIFGWGLLPMSPLFAFLAAARLRHHLRTVVREGRPTPLPGLWRGAALGFAAIVLFHLPSVLTDAGLRMATAESPVVRARGLRWLRSFGNERDLLRACYGRTRWAENMDLFGWLFAGGRRVSDTDARSIYYQVTGWAFNTVAPPRIYTARGQWNILEEEFTWDHDQGGASVAGRVKGLSLVSSRQDGLIDADAALTYIEWTLEFKNVSTIQREARTQIHLPPGGVVSRLTLWINGEEREAAFGPRSQVREAYQKVVTQRRDPVLVTTCGPDRVLVQCFPVPPNGGSMKVRLGVTAPLTLVKGDQATFRWPCFLERNFTLPEDLRHTVWVESRQPFELEDGSLKTSRSRSGLAVVRGDLTENELASLQHVLRVHRDASVRQVWTVDSRADAGSVIRQAIAESDIAPVRRVVLVVDGSQPMRDHIPAIAGALEGFPDGIEFALLVANDGIAERRGPVVKGSPDVYRRAAEDLRRLKTAGGQDNVDALVRAWDMAAESSAGVVVWVHGPQPILLDNIERLRQRFERRPLSPIVYEIETQSGPNRITESLDGVAVVKSVPRLGELSDDLKRLFESWNGAGKPLALTREHLDGTLPAVSIPGNPTSLHLARLWAFDEIRRLISERKREQAMELAARYQLVTPVSGAVVLETQAQYQAAGLRPVKAQSVPSVPEPSTGALLVAAGILLVLLKSGRITSAARLM